MAADLKPANEKTRLQFYQGKLDHIDISDRFNVVTFVDVMHHVPVADRHSLFINAIDRIQPPGMLLYKDISNPPRWRAWANQLHDLVIAREWVHLVAIEDIEQWAAESGLVLEYSQYIPMLWYGHDLRIWSKNR